MLSEKIYTKKKTFTQFPSVPKNRKKRKNTDFKPNTPSFFSNFIFLFCREFDYLSFEPIIMRVELFLQEIWPKN